MTALIRRPAAALDGALQWWLQVPRLVRWGPVLLLAGMLWWSSSQRPRRTEPDVVGALLHNAMHVVAFAALAGAAWCALRAPHAARDRAASLAAVMLATVYGIVDEVHQSFVPGRVASAWDVASDACGALLGTWWLHCRLVARRVDMRGWWLAAVSVVSVAGATFG